MVLFFLSPSSAAQVCQSADGELRSFRDRPSGVRLGRPETVRGNGGPKLVCGPPRVSGGAAA
eukprot:6921111-Pyramimonas_sp.AAC.1